MFKGFRDFLLRGNVVDLAVAVIIGAALTAIITSFVADIITPLIAAVGGQPDYSSIMLGPMRVGNFLNAVISFVIIAAVVYFLIVVPMNRAMAYMKRNEPAPKDPEISIDQKLLTEIRDSLQRQQR